MVDRGDREAERAVGTGYFVSSYTHSLDPKKRLTIPAEWRASVGEPAQLFILPAAGRQCLVAYPARDMARHIEKLRNLPAASPRDRQMARTILASMTDLVSWDAQGRIRVRDHLLGFAGLEGQVFMTGNFEGFELWNPARWQTVTGATDSERLLEATQQMEW